MLRQALARNEITRQGMAPSFAGQEGERTRTIWHSCLFLSAQDLPNTARSTDFDLEISWCGRRASRRMTDAKAKQNVAEENIRPCWMVRMVRPGGADRATAWRQLTARSERGTIAKELTQRVLSERAARGCFTENAEGLVVRAPRSLAGQEAGGNEEPSLYRTESESHECL